MTDNTNKKIEEIAVNAQPLSNITDVLLDNTSNPLVPKESNYSMIRQDPTTNALARVSSKSNIIQKDFTTTGIIQTQNGSTNLAVIISEYGNVTLKQSTSKLLRLLTINFTETGSKNKLLSIPLKNAMKDLGLNDIKSARKTIKGDLEALYNVSCEAQRTNYKGEKDHIAFRILDMQAIKNGVIYVNLSDQIFSHLKRCELMPYPKTLLRIRSDSQKNPYSYYLGDKIVEQKKYHLFENSFQVSVKTLINECTRNGMPTYESIKNRSRHVNKLIIEPFERDLEACSTDIFEWEYCNKKGAPLTDEQISCETKKGKYKPQTYKDFEELYIRVTFKNDYPVNEFTVKKSKGGEGKQGRPQLKKTTKNKK